MKHARRTAILVTLLLMVTQITTALCATLPSWIDPKTGHRIIRLADEPNVYSLYFHQNGFTPDGRGVIIYDAHNIYLLNIDTGRRDIVYNWEVDDARPTAFVMARREAHLYLLVGAQVSCINLANGTRRVIGVLPPGWTGDSSLTVNSDETLVAGNHTTGVAATEASSPRRQWIGTVESQRPDSLIFTMRIDTGAVTVLHRDQHWLDHPQFSPSDPVLLSFNREIPPDRHMETGFTIRSSNAEPMPILPTRTTNETILHSFFSPSGREIWYDLQAPWGRNFFVGASSVNGETNRRYPIAPAFWSLHYNLSPDETLVAGDGNPVVPDGKWLNLFRREGDKLVAERLVDLRNQNYALEPNVQFTPDGRWILFRGNFTGEAHPYLVEVARTGQPAPAYHKDFGGQHP